MTDSLTSADVLASGRAGAPLMRHVHARLAALPDFDRLRGHSLVEHCYGETNILADADSRGYDDVLRQLCVNLNMHYVLVDASYFRPPECEAKPAPGRELDRPRSNPLDIVASGIHPVADVPGPGVEANEGGRLVIDDDGAGAQGRDARAQRPYAALRGARKQTAKEAYLRRPQSLATIRSTVVTPASAATP